MARSTSSCGCAGFRIDGCAEFDELVTIPGGFGNVSAEYCSALAAHNGHASFKAARQAGDAAYVDRCTAWADAYSGTKLYSADLSSGSLRASLCSGQPWGTTGMCFPCYCLTTEMAPGEGSIARRMETRRKRGGDAPSKFTRKSFRSSTDHVTAERAQEATLAEAAHWQQQQRAAKDAARRAATAECSAAQHAAGINKAVDERVAASAHAAFTAASCTAASDAAKATSTAADERLLCDQVARQRAAAGEQVRHTMALGAKAHLACLDVVAERAASTQQMVAMMGNAALEQQRGIFATALAEHTAGFTAAIAHQTAAFEATLLEVQQQTACMIAATRVEVVSSMPETLQKIYRADLSGRLEQFPEATQLIDGMATCLEKGSTRGRRLNATEAHFYGMLLNSGNPWVEQFVAKNMFGASLRWAKEHRASLPTIPIGEISKENIELLWKILCSFGMMLKLESLPFLLCVAFTSLLTPED